MTSDRVLRLAAIIVGLLVAAYVLRFAVGNFANVSLLGGLLFLEILLACVWKFEQRVFPLMIVVFAWSGLAVPMQMTWTVARWPVLATGAVAGMIVWMRKAHGRFSAFHLVALLCALSAFISATVSPIPQMAGLKAFSLLLLLLYGSGGVRAAAFGREQRFFRGLQLACEIIVYATAVGYFVLGANFWGNPNSFGAAMSMGTFPILFWGWYTSAPGMGRWRRLGAASLCAFLGFFSLARAGMVAIVLTTLAFCFALREYKLLLKLAVIMLGAVATFGMMNPGALSRSAASISDAVLYKGHKEEGVLGSRRSPWEKTVSTIKQHPWFGTGYGTSLTNDDTSAGFGRYSSVAYTSREHGSSYMTIIEWVGLLGVVPFLALVGLNAFNIFRVGLWMRRTGSAAHYAVPLAMTLLAGMIHSAFEDSMFAVGSYLCLFFWSVAFLLVDMLPSPVVVPHPRVVRRNAPNFALNVEATAHGR